MKIRTVRNFTTYFIIFEWLMIFTSCGEGSIIKEKFRPDAGTFTRCIVPKGIYYLKISSIYELPMGCHSALNVGYIEDFFKKHNIVAEGDTYCTLMDIKQDPMDPEKILNSHMSLQATVYGFGFTSSLTMMAYIDVIYSDLEKKIRKCEFQIQFGLKKYEVEE
jgi:hypothetical protein